MWNWLLRPLFFLIPAERAHHLAMSLLAFLTALPFGRAIASRMGGSPSPRLRSEVFGLSFKSPIGLAAGFDKDAKHIHNLGLLGFPAVEVGTLTAHAQPGNPLPRLFRLPADRALLNRFGFNNSGSQAAIPHLAASPAGLVLGVNIGKSKITPNEEADQDYLLSFERVWPHAHYITVNVSSPNTTGLRDLQAREPLKNLLSALRARNLELAEASSSAPRPLLVKIAPDLDDDAIADIASLAVELELDGIIATNTTLNRDGLRTPADEVTALGAGGISGAPLTERSRDVVSLLYRSLDGKLPIIGVGGVMSADDAWEMARAGAALIQVYSGFIYGGPSFVRDLHDGLAAHMEAAGISEWAEVVGAAHRSDAQA